MAGVNRTKGLKFDHPGLGTTATRSGDRLVIQNDIGLTEAHVLVVHLEPPKVTVTYTDVHLERLLFFQSLLDAVSRSGGRTRSPSGPRGWRRTCTICVWGRTWPGTRRTWRTTWISSARGWCS